MRIDPTITAKLTLFSDEKKTLDNALDIIWELHEKMTAENLDYLKTKKDWFSADNLHFVAAVLEFLTNNLEIELSNNP